MESKRTPLYGVHRALGARMIEFGGWQMPVQYTGILAEHRAVRTQGGLFDLSHMGEIEIAGPRAYAVCQELFVTDIARIRIMQAQYSVMCFTDGGIVDDVIVYRLAEERYLVCVNAANRTTDYEWMVEHNRGRAEVIDRSDEYALVAIQGPQAQTVLSQLTPHDLASIRRYWAAQGEVAGVPTLLARTGYTGEDGFELFVPAERAEHIWQACSGAGGVRIWSLSAWAHGIRSAWRPAIFYTAMILMPGPHRWKPVCSVLSILRPAPLLGPRPCASSRLMGLKNTWWGSRWKGRVFLARGMRFGVEIRRSGW